MGWLLRNRRKSACSWTIPRDACLRAHSIWTRVCGVAAETKTTQLVADVHQFPGHIACDSASNSEIVVPIIKDGNVIGVLDIDSPEKSFRRSRSRYLEKFVETLLKHM